MRDGERQQQLRVMLMRQAALFGKTIQVLVIKFARLCTDLGRACRARWLDAEWLPVYAPDLNPVEAMWSCTKHGDLANFVPDDLYDLGDAVVDSLTRQRDNLRMKKSYFQTAQLDL